ncbi:MAG: hypothetical protein R3D59_03030 [Paracoccaceae bacterium]
MITFFDLDGTLVDSAPDLMAAANRMLADEGHAPLDLRRSPRSSATGCPSWSNGDARGNILRRIISSGSTTR